MSAAAVPGVDDSLIGAPAEYVTPTTRPTLAEAQAWKDEHAALGEHDGALVGAHHRGIGEVGVEVLEHHQRRLAELGDGVEHLQRRLGDVERGKRLRPAQAPRAFPKRLRAEKEGGVRPAARRSSDRSDARAARRG